MFLLGRFNPVRASLTRLCVGRQRTTWNTTRTMGRSGMVRALAPHQVLCGHPSDPLAHSTVHENMVSFSTTSAKYPSKQAAMSGRQT
jgi:hypothetical protein